MRGGLWILPCPSVLRTIRALGDRRRGQDERGGRPFERVVWVVGAADRVVPRTTPLVRALAVQVLLARRGPASQLRLGLAGGGGRALEAHAWLEGDERARIGDPIQGRYAFLSPVETPR